MSQYPKVKTFPYPSAGNAVRLTAVWPWAGNLIKVGSLGIIDGVEGAQQECLRIIWNYSAHRSWVAYGCPEADFRHREIEEKLGKCRDNNPVFVNCSGGPGTIALPAKLLTSTEELATVRFWCWKDLPRANGGYQYMLDVPVWEWNGKGY